MMKAMRCSVTLGLLASAGLVSGCAKTSLDDSRYATGSQSMVASSDHRALYVANVLTDSVTRVDVDSQTATEVAVGSEPTRIARAGDRVFVTLRGERNLAVLQETATGLTLERTVAVGAEPYAVIAPEDGKKIYVSVSQGGEVLEMDPLSLEVLRRWPVQGEPRWMAIHPSGNQLFVTSAMQPLLTVIETDSGKVSEVQIPSIDFGGANRPARITGDPAVSPDGQYVAVPTLHMDHEQPIDDESLPPPGGYYGGRFGPTVTIVPVGEGRAEINRAVLVSLPQGGDLMGYPSSATWSPDGEELWMSIEGAAGVMTVDLSSPENQSSIFEAFFVGTDDGVVDGAVRTLTFWPTVSTRAPEGTRSVAFLDDERAFAYGFIDRTVSQLPTQGVRDSLPSASSVAFSVPELVVPSATTMRVQTAAQPFTPELAEGLLLFYSTTDPRVTSGGSGLSCATCHFEGRDDGLSWTFLRGKRQTPSLAGQVSLTEPVRWEGDRVTVEEDAMMTSRDAMGGEGMDESELANIASFIDWIRDVDVARPSVEDPAVVRGQAIFERSDVACASCHNGPRLTDNQTYAMFGINVQTRSLVGLKATAPYMHNGAAATLADVVEMAQGGEMGNTSMLDAQQKADLVRYLESL